MNNNFKNGWAKNLVRSVIDCIRTTSLCSDHRDAVGVYVAIIHYVH